MHPILRIVPPLPAGAVFLAVVLAAGCRLEPPPGADGGTDAEPPPVDANAVCGNGLLEPGEDCEPGMALSVGCADAAEPVGGLADGSLGCYAAGTLADDGIDVSCRYDFRGCIGPDLRVYGPDLSSGAFLEVNASVSSCEAARCAGGMDGLALLHFNLSSWNAGNAALEFGNPMDIAAPYAGLWSQIGCAGVLEWTDYADYWLEDAAGNRVASGKKGSFCFIDGFGTTPDPTWSGPDCVPTHDCLNMGMGAGCYDAYLIGLECQYIDVTGVPTGSYTLCAEVDYNGRVAELDDHNNRACVPVSVN